MKICLCCEGVTNTTAQRCGHCGAWLLPVDSVHYPGRRGEADSGNPLLGTVIDGKYRLQAVLGRGGLGTVFQAVHVGSLMSVALKLLHPRFAERPEYRRALVPEARRAATVMHERCARLLDVGEAEEGVAYLAMELVEGETLDVLVRGGPMAPAHAVDVLLQVAEALVAIHAAGLVHCDLSARNVMVTCRDGRLHVKVLDFGIARTVTLAGAGRSRAGEFAGFVNPAFSAPELLAGKEVDPRADLYSFGTLAWLLLTGAMPTDDADPRRAARAIAARELRPWPKVPGVPRRLLRLVERCLQQDPADRPASASAVLAELAIVRGARRPAVARTAVVVAAVAVVALLLVEADAPPPFLRPWAGSRLELSDRTPSAATPVQDLRSSELATLGFHFGGFPPHRLRIDVSRGGFVMLKAPLRPEVDVDAGTLTLATAQPLWRDAVQGLLSSSHEGPVDVSFVVPGAAPLATARLQLDDEPPHLEWSLGHVEDGAITSRTTLAWRADDTIGVAAVDLTATFRDGRRVHVPLPGPRGEIALGERLAEAIGSVAELGAGEVAVVARDRAGNTSSGEATAFARADLQAPAVLEVTGSAGEAFVPCVGGTARLRVRLSAVEAGCHLHVVLPDGSEHARVPLAGAAVWQVLEVPQVGALSTLASGPLVLAVVDGAGNRTERPYVLNLRDRSLRVAFVGDGPDPVSFATELVLGEAGGVVLFTCGEVYVVARGNLELSTGGNRVDAGERFRSENLRPGAARFVFGALPAGSHRLQLQLEEAAGDTGHRVLHEVAVRVLPEAIEVRVPKARSRFLPAFLDAGVLVWPEVGLHEGPGWRVAPDLVGYLRGTLWVGSQTFVPVPLPARERVTDPLLPAVQPIPGHNVLAVELRDVLGRPARVLVGDGGQTRREYAGHTLDVVADFWWHDGKPEVIGEEVLVEHGQPARLRLRMPLPYAEDELPELRLGLAQNEVAAAYVTADGVGGSTVTFEVPFATWRVAAQLADLAREDYARQIERNVEAYVATPVGRHSAVALRLRTTRSTLQSVQLSDLGVVPADLAGLRLVPVLAPEAEFAEPVPATSPPRAMFRTQVAVAVRNLGDLLLQDREFQCGEARALAAFAAAGLPGIDRRDLVHADDPRGVGRLEPAALLPALVATAAADQPVTGVDFYQAYACCRLLGLLVGADPELFRLPLGCELELAAYGGAVRPACHGAAAVGGGVSMVAFAGAAAALPRGVAPTAGVSRRAGDFVPTAFGVDFCGLDFGVREWVGDLPNVDGAELLLGEWIGDHAIHLARTAAFARGAATPADLAGALRTFGVVRGLGLGELAGLIGNSGDRLDPQRFTLLPPSVPGVLRTEQLRRDGRDLLSSRPDPRLAHVGFRVAGTNVLLARLRGRP